MRKICKFDIKWEKNCKFDIIREKYEFFLVFLIFPFNFSSSLRHLFPLSLVFWEIYTPDSGSLNIWALNMI